MLPVEGEVFVLRKLLPQSEEYDFNIHIMDFKPGGRGGGRAGGLLGRRAGGQAGAGWAQPYGPGAGPMHAVAAPGTCDAPALKLLEDAVCIICALSAGSSASLSAAALLVSSCCAVFVRATRERVQSRGPLTGSGDPTRLPVAPFFAAWPRPCDCSPRKCFPTAAAAGEHLNVKEVHYNQHGLLLLTGKGIYRLADSWYPVQVGGHALGQGKAGQGWLPAPPGCLHGAP